MRASHLWFARRTRDAAVVAAFIAAAIGDLNRVAASEELLQWTQNAYVHVSPVSSSPEIDARAPALLLEPNLVAVEAGQFARWASSDVTHVRIARKGDAQVSAKPVSIEGVQQAGTFALLTINQGGPEISSAGRAIVRRLFGAVMGQADAVVRTWADGRWGERPVACLRFPASLQGVDVVILEPRDGRPIPPNGGVVVSNGRLLGIVGWAEGAETRRYPYLCEFAHLGNLDAAGSPSLQREPDHHELRAALCLEAFGRFEEAFKAFGALELDPLWITERQARCRQGQGRLREAQELVREYASTHGRFALLAADLSAARGSMEEAIGWTRRAIAAGRDDPEPLLRQALWNTQLGHSAAALQAAKAALALAPESARVSEVVALVLRSQGRLDEAVPFTGRAAGPVLMGPSLARAAIESLERIGAWGWILDLVPRVPGEVLRQPLMQGIVGRAALEEGKYEKAVDLLKSAVRSGPGDDDKPSRFRSYFVRSLYRFKMWGEAASELRLLMLHEPDNWGWPELLVRVASKMGNETLVEEGLRRLDQLNPSRAKAVRATLTGD